MGKLWKLPLCGSRGKIKLQGNFPTASTIAWKTLRKKQKRGDFPTVPTASAAGFNLEPETGEPSRNLLREAARNLPWEALGASGTWLAARKLNRSRLGESFFLTAPFHRTSGSYGAKRSQLYGVLSLTLGNTVISATH